MKPVKKEITRTCVLIGFDVEYSFRSGENVTIRDDRSNAQLHICNQSFTFKEVCFTAAELRSTVLRSVISR